MRLKAAFTGFPPIRVDSETTTFAQVVSPFDAGGMFHGAFAVRPVGGGIAQFAEFGPIPFAHVSGDFDFDDDVDGSEFLAWKRGFGTTFGSSDLDDWEANFGTTTPLLLVSTIVPEPSSIVLFGGLFVMMLASRKPLFV